MWKKRLILPQLIFHVLKKAGLNIIYTMFSILGWKDNSDFFFKIKKKKDYISAANHHCSAPIYNFSSYRPGSPSDYYSDAEFSEILSAVIPQKLRAEVVQIPTQSFATKNTTMKCSVILSLYIIDIFQKWILQSLPENKFSDFFLRSGGKTVDWNINSNSIIFNKTLSFY